MKNEAPDMLVKYLILGVLKDWYIKGKTEATLFEVYDALGVSYDSSDEDIIFDISKQVTEVDDMAISAGMNNRLH